MSVLVGSRRKSRKTGKVSVWTNKSEATRSEWKREVKRKKYRKKKREKKAEKGPAAGLLLLIQHFNKSMPLEEYNPHPELS